MPEIHPLQQYLPHSKQYFYHYTSWGGLGHILLSRSLMFGPYLRTNDPRENKKWLDEAEARVSIAIVRDDLRVELHRLLQQTARMACFAVDRDSSMDPDSLLHCGFARPRMWQQYADQNRGACLVFDSSLLAKAADEVLGRYQGLGLQMWNHEISYVDELRAELGDFSGVNSKTELQEVLGNRLVDRGAPVGLSMPGALFKNLYLTKVRDWQSEEEYRIAGVLWYLPNEMLDSALPAPFEEALLGVIVGESYRDRGNLKTIVEDHFGSGVLPILQCQWRDGGARLKSV